MPHAFRIATIDEVVFSQEFEEAFEEIVQEQDAATLLEIPGVRELLKAFYHDDAIDLAILKRDGDLQEEIV